MVSIYVAYAFIFHLVWRSGSFGAMKFSIKRDLCVATRNYTNNVRSSLFEQTRKYIHIEFLMRAMLRQGGDEIWINLRLNKMKSVDILGAL